jgi:hypothetical protein
VTTLENGRLLVPSDSVKDGRVYQFISELDRMYGVTLVGVDHAPGHGGQAWRFRKVVSAEPSFIKAFRQREPFASCSR